jgi:hypothetical protein
MREDNSFQEIDKARIFSKRENLSTEHFIELIEKRDRRLLCLERKYEPKAISKMPSV